jgi:hypothetical protein
MESAKSAQGKLRLWIGLHVSHLFVTVAALGLLVYKIKEPKAVDAVSVGLLLLALTPWLADFLQSIVIGTSKVEFRKLEERQDNQEEQMRLIRFLIMNLLPGYEIKHLEKFQREGEFWIDINIDTNEKFGNELRHLRDLGFIRQLGRQGVRSLIERNASKEPVVLREGKQSRDAKAYFQITDAGSEYLQLQKAAQGAAKPDPEVKSAAEGGHD